MFFVIYIYTVCALEGTGADTVQDNQGFDVVIINGLDTLGDLSSSSDLVMLRILFTKVYRKLVSCLVLIITFCVSSTFGEENENCIVHSPFVGVTIIKFVVVTTYRCGLRKINAQ